MRSDREKLIALIQAAVNGCSTYWAGLIADYLLANGVTFATDNHVGGKWIPVTERLPEVGADILVCHKNGFVATNAWLGTHWWFKDDKNTITHWMPLPEPPKEG